MRAVLRLRLPLLFAIAALGWLPLPASERLGRFERLKQCDTSLSGSHLRKHAARDCAGHFQIGRTLRPRSGASQHVQDTLGKVRLAAIKASLPTERPLPEFNGQSQDVGQLAINASTATPNSWTWAVVDRSQRQLADLRDQDGWRPWNRSALRYRSRSAGSVYWKYDPNGHVGLFTQTPPYVQWSGADFIGTVNDGRPI